MIESGIIYNWINEVVSNYSYCDTIPKVLGSHEKPLTVFQLEEVQTFFGVIFCGFILSLVGFSSEHIWNKCQSIKNQRSRVNNVGSDDVNSHEEQEMNEPASDDRNLHQEWEMNEPGSEDLSFHQQQEPGSDDRMLHPEQEPGSDDRHFYQEQELGSNDISFHQEQENELGSFHQEQNKKWKETAQGVSKLMQRVNNINRLRSAASHEI